MFSEKAVTGAVPQGECWGPCFCTSPLIPWMIDRVHPQQAAVVPNWEEWLAHEGTISSGRPCFEELAWPR